ncbi:hypothetical protein MGG_16120, partial [Pyricularia oryzae 70-15]
QLVWLSNFAFLRIQYFYFQTYVQIPHADGNKSTPNPSPKQTELTLAREIKGGKPNNPAILATILVWSSHPVDGIKALLPAPPISRSPRELLLDGTTLSRITINRNNRLITQIWETRGLKISITRT